MGDNLKVLGDVALVFGIVVGGSVVVTLAVVLSTMAIMMHGAMDLIWLLHLDGADRS